MRVKHRPGMPKPQDARTLLKPDAASSLFVPSQSHASVVRETAAKLDAYTKGTPAGLQKFYAAREMIAREDGRGGGSSSAGSPGVGGQGGGAGGGGEVVRDPRLRR